VTLGRLIHDSLVCLPLVIGSTLEVQIGRYLAVASTARYVPRAQMTNTACGLNERPRDRTR
jgi:hypothetical protein